MKIRQIFSEYNPEQSSPARTAVFCQTCGTVLIHKPEGGVIRPACPQCGFVLYKNPAPAVSVVVVEQEQVLLGRRATGSFKAGLWCLPCGFIEFAEDYLTAARREVREETGLVVEIETILSVVSNAFSSDLHTLVVVLLARVAGGELHPGDDIEAVEWFPLAGPFPDMAFAADEHIIARYHQTRLSGAPVEKAGDLQGGRTEK